MYFLLCMRDREGDDNNSDDDALVHKDKDLSTSRHFYHSVPDDKHMALTLNTAEYT